MKIVNIELSKLRNSDISEEDAKRESKKILRKLLNEYMRCRRKLVE